MTPPMIKNPDAGHTWSDYVFDKKPLKFFFSRTSSPMILKLGMPHQCFKLCVDLDLFNGKVKLGVGSKSHCRATPAVPCPICCTSNLIFINYVSLKPYVSHIYFTVVNRTKIVFCSKLCFY